MLLADIAHIGSAVDRYLFGRHRGGGDGVPALAFELVVDAGEIVKRRIVEPGRPGAHVVIAQVRVEHAEGRENAGSVGDDDPADSGLAGDLQRMDRSRAAEGYQPEA